MTKASLKTLENNSDVNSFLARLSDDSQRTDCMKILKWMKEFTNEEPKMWGNSIIGFGKRHLIYESGRELDWFIIGFAPRKGVISLYLPLGVEGFSKYSEFSELGKYKTGKGCLYIKKLSEVDEEVLKSIIKSTIRDNN